MTRPLAGALLVALWLGAALLTVTVVAPGAFAVLPTRTIAGEMVGRVLPVGFGGVIVVPALVFWLVPRCALLPALAASAFAVLSSVVALAVVNPRIAAVRVVAVVPIDQLSPGDPRRALFGLLHFISVALLGAAMLALGGLLVTLARTTVSRVRTSGEAR